MDYRIISDEKDAAAFLAEANGLHDGYIVSVNYQHQGYTWGNPIYIDPEKTKMVLCVMVTSIYDTLIEIVFESIKDFQIKDADYELLDSSISFSKVEVTMVFSSDDSTFSNFDAASSSLALRNLSISGYKRLSLIRAFSRENCQLIGI